MPTGLGTTGAGTTPGPENIGISSVAGAAVSVISSAEGRVDIALATAADPNASAGEILTAQFTMADYSLRVTAGSNIFNSYAQALRSSAQNIN